MKVNTMQFFMIGASGQSIMGTVSHGNTVTLVNMDAIDKHGARK